MEEFNFLRETRDDLKLTQQEVAVFLGVSRVTYIKYEQNPDVMPLGLYMKLLEEFERLRKIQGGLDGVE